jgi:hypothetical protein
MKLTQENLVLNFLTNGGRFTTRKARSIGVANPSAVVDNLRNKGYEIYSQGSNANGNSSFWTLCLPSEKAARAQAVLRSEVLS